MAPRGPGRNGAQRAAFSGVGGELALYRPLATSHRLDSRRFLPLFPAAVATGYGNAPSGLQGIGLRLTPTRHPVAKRFDGNPRAARYRRAFLWADGAGLPKRRQITDRPSYDETTLTPPRPPTTPRRPDIRRGPLRRPSGAASKYGRTSCGSKGPRPPGHPTGPIAWARRGGDEVRTSSLRAEGRGPWFAHRHILRPGHLAAEYEGDFSLLWGAARIFDGAPRRRTSGGARATHRPDIRRGPSRWPAVAATKVEGAFSGLRGIEPGSPPRRIPSPGHPAGSLTPAC